MESNQIELDLLHAALDGAGFGLAVTDASGRILIANREFATLMSVDHSQVLGALYLELFSTFVSNPDFHRVFRHGEVACNTEIMGKDGDRLRYILIKGEDAQINSSSAYRVVSAFDVTNFGITREQLAAHRRQLDALENAVVIADASRKDCPIVYVNAAFEKLTGYAPSEAVGRNCRFLQGPDTRPEAVAHIAESVKTGKSCHVILKNYRKSGEEFLNELFISPVYDPSGNLTQFVGIQHEIATDSARQGAVK